MMREIKFRQPVYDSYNNFCGFHYWGFIDGKFIEPIIHTNWLSQFYTCFKDETKKEIYQDDVIEWNQGALLIQSPVFWSDIGGWFPFIGGIKFEFLRSEDSRIIGNFCENPELSRLKGW